MPCFRDCVRLLAAAAPFLLPVPQALAQATASPTAAELAEEIGALKSEYESAFEPWKTSWRPLKPNPASPRRMRPHPHRRRE